MTEATPAATVVILRDSGDRLEALMLERNPTGSFGGMWVFPGGKVESGDHALAPDELPPDELDADELDAARRAAAREAAEEAGVALDPAALVPLSHWTPPPTAPRRFTTWFFLTRWPEGATVEVDGAEIHAHRWLSPADALRRRDEGELSLAVPTCVTLWGLAGAQNVAVALGRAERADPARYTTHLVHGEAGPVALWFGDAAYDDGDLSRPGGRHRLVMGRTPWRYEGPVE